MYFSQIFPMIFLLISLKSCTFAAEIIFSGMNGIEERKEYRGLSLVPPVPCTAMVVHVFESFTN